MEAFIEWAIANPELSGPLLFAVLDIVAGWLPDRFTKWPGVILAAADKAYNFGKEVGPVVEQAKAAGLDPDFERKAIETIRRNPEIVEGLIRDILVTAHRKRSSDALMGTGKK